MLWIDEIMAEMEFLIARATASVRESANLGHQELEAVLVTGLSDVAVDGRKSLVGRPADKLLLVERDVRGITRDNQKVSSRGRTTKQRKRKPLQPEKTAYEALFFCSLNPFFDNTK